MSKAKARRVLQGNEQESIRPGLRWEVEQIRQLGRADRTVLVMPPPRPGKVSSEAARRQAAVILTLLVGGGVAEWETWIDDEVLLLRPDPRNVVHQTVQANPPGVKRAATAVGTYQDAFSAALAAISRDHPSG